MNKPLKITLISIGGILIILLLAFLYLSFDSQSRLNVLKHRIFSRSDDFVNEEIIPAWRGRILASDGGTLVESESRFDIYMDCCVVEDSTKWTNESLALADSLSKKLPVRSALEWWAYFQHARNARDRYICIVKDITGLQKDSLRALPLFRDGQFEGGIIVEHKFIRVYPYDSLARRTLGYKRPGLTTPGIGLEGRFDVALSGVNGTRTVKYSTRNGKRRQREIGYQDPIHGYDILTTLDMSLQAMADSALRLAFDADNAVDAGCLILMDAKTGGIKAMVNLNRTEDGSLKEYYNYAIGRSYEPGEIVSDLTLETALPDRLDFDIVGLRDVDLVNPGNNLLITPLHVLAYYNTVATGGTMMKPYLVERLVPCDGDPKGVVEYGPAVLKEKVLLPEFVTNITRDLKVCAVDGIAGKGCAAKQILPTNEQAKDAYTDSTGRHQYAATFAGFFPADAPQYSIVCTVFTSTTTKSGNWEDVPTKAVRRLVNSIE